MILVKVEIPPGLYSRCFNNIKVCFLIQDPKDLTREVVINFLNNKISKLESQKDSEFTLNNNIACLNFINTYVPEEKWVYICEDKTKASISISPENNAFIKFSVFDFEDLTGKQNVY